MITVCAWCERFLGASGRDQTVTHGICASCAASQRSPDVPTIVIARHRAEMRAVLERLLRGDPAIQVVIDRRVGDRRRSRSAPDAAWEHRRGPDRRRRPADAVLT